MNRAERLATVRDRPSRYRIQGATVEFDQCVRDLDDAACIRRLRAVPTDVVKDRLALPGIRRAFAVWVLRRGGEGAYSRLVESPELPLDRRFAAAGRMPIDSLVAAWRGDLLAARPAPSTPTPASAATTLLWVLAAAGLAVRTSRCR
jgi:hypothetical protein